MYRPFRPWFFLIRLPVVDTTGTGCAGPLALVDAMLGLSSKT